HESVAQHLPGLAAPGARHSVRACGTRRRRISKRSTLPIEFGAVIRTSRTEPERSVRCLKSLVRLTEPAPPTNVVRRLNGHFLPLQRSSPPAFAGASCTRMRTTRAPVLDACQSYATTATSLAGWSPPTQSSSTPLPGISGAPGCTVEFVSSQSAGG